VRVKVVRPGRRFLRGMIQVLAIAKKPLHYVMLNETFRGDLEWWHAFLGPWNGDLCCLRCKLRILRLRSGVMFPEGRGVLQFRKVSGLEIQWSDQPNSADTMIAAKELLPIVVAGAVQVRYRNYSNSTYA